METILQLSDQNLEKEHICCAISDKKCLMGYEAKKEWMQNSFSSGYEFHRLDARAKVFIEFGPTETSWLPVEAPNTLVIGCFWVSGRYKKQGYGKKLLQIAISRVKELGKRGLLTVVGKKKMHFMSDTKWLLRQGFEEVDRCGEFSLLYLPLISSSFIPSFRQNVTTLLPEKTEGVTIFYSNRCPFTEFHVNENLIYTLTKRNIPYKLVKLSTVEEAQMCASPATIFSLYFDGKFITTDISACMDQRFDRIVLGKK